MRGTFSARSRWFDSNPYHRAEPGDAYLSLEHQFIGEGRKEVLGWKTAS